MSHYLNCMKINPVSLPEKFEQKDSLIPCFITKLINYENLALQFICHQDVFEEFSTAMRTYYNSKSVKSLEFIKQIKDPNKIYTSLFILNWGGDYFRCKILESWSTKKYFVTLIDYGFNCLADDDYLFLNDNFDFLIKPSYGFVFGVKLNLLSQPFPGPRHKCILNYILQIISTSFEEFLVKFDHVRSENVKLFIKAKNGEIIDIETIVNEIYFAEEIIRGIGKNFENYQILDEKLKNTIANCLSLSNHDISTTTTNVDTNHFEESSEEGLIVHALLKDDEPMLMRIKQVINPHKFYLKFVEDPDYDKLKIEMKNYFIKQHGDKNFPKNLELNRMYAVKNEKNRFIRVLVLDRDNKAPNNYHCFLIDKGREESFPLSQFYMLPNQFKRIPPKSVCARLDFVKPRDNLAEWDHKSIKFFKSELDNKIVEIIKNSFDEENHILNCNMAVNDYNFAEILIDAKLADCE